MVAKILEKLDWDSQFFGYSVAKIDCSCTRVTNILSLFKEIEKLKTRLTYIFLRPEDQELNFLVMQKGGILVDQKTTYSKTTAKHHSFMNQIMEWTDEDPNEKLRQLALTAGLFSRFKKDPNFKEHEFERLYTEWLTNSLNKQMAFSTFVALKNAGPVGIITLGEKKTFIDIGLVAVDEMYRGQGVGTDIIRFADSLAFDMGHHEIKVVTQLQNKGACQLYEKNGFNITNITNIYHYWI